MLPKHYDFILKPVGSKCNLSCSYCYYPQNQKPSDNNNQFWSIEFGKQVIKELVNFESRRGNSKVSVTWHGGEPLLAGVDWYSSIFEYQKSFSKIHFSNSFQTNGTLLSEEYCELFKNSNASIGISLDGPANIHNTHRKTKGKQNTFDKIMNGINLCRKKEIRFGVLCVVTKDSVHLSKEIIEFFFQNDIYGLDFLPVYSLNESEKQVFSLGISPNEFFVFMKTVFDWYIEKDNPSIKIRSIVSMIELLLGGQGGVCTISGNTCGSFLTIESDGSVSFCDDYNAEIFPVLGNILKCSISEIIQSELFFQSRRLTLSRSSMSLDCKNCNIKKICRGGCPRHWEKESNYFCNYYRKIFPYIAEKIQSLIL